MTDKSQVLNKCSAWNALATHHEQVRNRHLRDLFTADTKRGERLTVKAVVCAITGRDASPASLKYRTKPR